MIDAIDSPFPAVYPDIPHNRQPYSIGVLTYNPKDAWLGLPCAAQRYVTQIASDAPQLKYSPRN